MADPDKKRGLYTKYTVRRNDRNGLPGGKHEHCEYYAIDLTHDPFALPALKAYAAACEVEYPLLARDLQKKIFQLENAQR